MELILVRHGIAEDREAWATAGKDDELRPLTVEGRHKLRRTAAGLATIVKPVELICHSPYVRTVETAAILAKSFPTAAVCEVAVLGDSGKAAAWMKWLATLDAERVLLVGHEPDISEFIGFALVGRAKSFVTIKKATACLLKFDGDLAASGAVLEWVLTSKILRRL